MRLQTILVDNSSGFTIVIGKSNSIRTIRELHQQLTNEIPGIKFGLTYIEPAKPRVVKYSGTDDELIDLAKRNACKIGVGNVFILCFENDFPLMAMKIIKNVDDICEIFCATPNPVEVIITENESGRNLMGLADDYSSSGKKERGFASNRAF